MFCWNDVLTTEFCDVVATLLPPLLLSCFACINCLWELINCFLCTDLLLYTKYNCRPVQHATYYRVWNIVNIDINAREFQPLKILFFFWIFHVVPSRFSNFYIFRFLPSNISEVIALWYLSCISFPQLNFSFFEFVINCSR